MNPFSLIVLSAGVVLLGAVCVPATNTTNVSTAGSQVATGSTSVCGLDHLTPFTVGQEILANNKFDNGTDQWQGQTYFSPTPAGDINHQLSVSDGVVTFAADAADPLSTRYGLLQTVNIDMRGATSIQLLAKVKVDTSSLGGTGQQGREAPVAVGLAYYDQNCVLHNGLPEDPEEGLASRLFWNGFYSQDPSGIEVSDFGTKVQSGEWFEYQVNLKQFNPWVITLVGVEGAGWRPRSGSVDEMSLIAQ